MSTGPAALIAAQGDKSPVIRDEGSASRAPLVPVAFAVTVGILLDCHIAIPLIGSLVASLLLLACFVAASAGKSSGLPLVYLALACAGLGASWHHYRRDTHRADDIGWLVSDETGIVQIRGILDAEPVTRARLRDDPLFVFRPGTEAGVVTTAVINVQAVRSRDDWTPVSGKVQVRCGPISDLHAGDEVEAAGRLEPLPRSENPGERDYERELRDDGIRAILRVKESTEAITRLGRASPTSITAMLARVRGWGVRVLRESFPERQAGLVAALLLGDNTLMPTDDWERYIQSGVIHVLVVSGQHLVILGGFLLICLRVLPIRERTRLLMILVFLWAYAIMAGGRPSVVRAATTFTIVSGAMFVRRQPLTLNALAAAWLFVLLLNPSDVNNVGCQLSFICVAGLYWIAQRRQALENKEVDPLDQLIEDSRPIWLRTLHAIGKIVLVSYLVSLLLWVVVTPLAAARMHFVAVPALLIGPPVVLLSSIALISGFLLLLAAVVLPPLVPILAWITSLMLGGCDALVNLSLGLWQRHGYISGLPSWWLIGVYLLLSCAVLLPSKWRSWRFGILAGLSWLSLLLLTSLIGSRSDELRVTFLSIGHGGCTVMETPDGRTLVYDAGSMRGPGVTRARIAPYLWSRGITRIDELFLSHGDLDHFNGVRDLLERFPIGRITCTPTFDQKDNRAIRHVVEQIEKSGVKVRIVSRGDRLRAGDVTLDVLYPPESGPEGPENVRSLVLLVRHARHRLLLTGDLEGVGLDEFVQKSWPVDVLMAPHHGSHLVPAARLMAQTKPALVVSCQGVKPDPDVPQSYRVPGVTYLGTWPHGAITVRSHASGLIVETFVTNERFVIRTSHRNE